MIKLQKKMEAFKEEDKKTRFFLELTRQLKDHRRVNTGNIRHPMHEILFLTLSSVVSGCKTWEEVEEFGNLKIDWLRKYFPYKYGIASHDTLGAFYSAFDKKQFANFFMEFTQNLAQKDSRVIAIDGKTIRGVASKFGVSPIHIVSAFCHQNRLTLCQETVNEKSNEITAIPDLIHLLDLKNCVVTIDAMGCQKDIAKKIRAKNGDYILQVKDNQKDLKEQIKKIFNIQKPKNEHVDLDTGHGRMEKRCCSVIDDLSFLDGKEDWKDIKTIVGITTEIYDKKTYKKSENIRYYISSCVADSKQLAQDIRNHWSIENNLHWNLDVIFKEDFQLKRKGNSAENFNMLIKLALGLIEAEKSKKKSKPIKMLIASIDDSYREKILRV
jgi:predicted transposase YbfD/YdcC